MKTSYDVLVVGAGHAGAQTCIALRQLKYGGTIALVSDEPELPYERPPLSKDYLSGEKNFERIQIRPASFWVSKEIDLHLNKRVASVDPVRHTATFADGNAVRYGSLVWATGGSPRQLSCIGGSLRGVMYVRSRADIDRILGRLPVVNDVVIIGGGYIGLEAAAVLTKFGKKVTVLEAQDRVLARVAAEPLSRFFEQEHRAKGVDLRLGVAVECVDGCDGEVSAVRLTDGNVLRADMVIVGIGIEPAVQPLIAAGATGINGVAVDRLCRTSLPDVFAIGDCALHVNDFAQGRSIRLESVQNANDMASTVAKAITGDQQPYHAVPWFWSHQYDLKLQTVGISQGFDQVLLRGDPVDRSFSVIYLRQGMVIALDCVNAPKDYVQGRTLVTSQAVIATEQLSDPQVPLNNSFQQRAA